MQALIQAEPLAGRTDHRTGQLTRLCRVLTTLVPALGVGLTISVGRGLSMTLTSSGDLADELDEMQLVLGEGPSLDVEFLSRPVLEPELARSGGQEWPAFSPAAGALGAAAVFGFPIQLGAVHLGALTVYRSDPGGLSRAPLRDCLHAAGIARDLILEDLDRDGAGEVLPPWAEVLPTPQLYQAQGMVMVQLGADPVDALARIRAHAYAYDQRIGAVAEAIISGNLTLNREES